MIMHSKTPGYELSEGAEHFILLDQSMFGLALIDRLAVANRTAISCFWPSE